MLVNELSNSGKARLIIEQYKKEIHFILEDVEINYISRGISLGETAIQKGEEFETIVACGGDGTARSVAIALKGTNIKFGLLPLGSGNDFAKSIGLTPSFVSNLEVLKRQRTSEIDVIKFNHQYFINTLGIGFDGYTNYLASRSKFNGTLKYIVSGFRALATVKSFHTEILTNEEIIELEAMMVIVANGSWEGGKYFVSPRSNNSDGIFELIVLKKTTRIRLFLEFVKLSLGFTFSSALVLKQSFESCMIKTHINQYVHADGELIENNNSFVVGIEKEKIRALN